MTPKEKKQLEHINTFLTKTANDTSINLDNKFFASIPYSMQLDYIGIGKIYDGLTLLNNYLYNFEGSYYISNGMGHISKNGGQTIFAPDLQEKTITEKDLYMTGNLLWFVNDECADAHFLSDWFINECCSFNKTRMDEFCRLIQAFVDGKKYMITNLYHPQGKILKNFGNICYYAFLKISNNNKYFKNDEYSFYFLNCTTHL